MSLNSSPPAQLTGSSEVNVPARGCRGDWLGMSSYWSTPRHPYASAATLDTARPSCLYLNVLLVGEPAPALPPLAVSKSTTCILPPGKSGSPTGKPMYWYWLKLSGLLELT